MDKRKLYYAQVSRQSVSVILEEGDSHTENILGADDKIIGVKTIIDIKPKVLTIQSDQTDDMATLYMEMEKDTSKQKTPSESYRLPSTRAFLTADEAKKVYLALEENKKNKGIEYDLFTIVRVDSKTFVETPVLKKKSATKK